MRSRRRLVGMTIALIVTMALFGSAMAGPRSFSAHLSGGDEVPANASKATGQANFKLSKDGTELSYKLIVANIDNVIMAHIHCAPAGQNGGVVVWLYPSSPPPAAPSSPNGVLIAGTITTDSITSPTCGATLADLVASIEAGNTYVNVHTTQFPGGEIRGQIR